MTRIEIVPFGEEHVQPAAELVVARYREARASIPQMPAEFESPEAIAPRISRELKLPGAAALHDAKFAGFLIGWLAIHRRDEFAYAPDHLHGAEPSLAEPVYRALYAHMARRWLDLGCFAHAITCYPTDKAALDVWFWLGFGLCCVDAIRGMEPPSDAPTGIDIRRATPEDAPAIAPLREGVERHLAAPPAYIPLLASSGPDEMARWLEDHKNAIWLAMDGSKPISYLKIGPTSGQVLGTQGPEIAGITGAYTEPEHRGRGILTALLARGLSWAREEGYTSCSVDFESANGLGTAFWLGSGFKPVAFSLERRINPRAAWAHERRSEEDLLVAPRAG